MCQSRLSEDTELQTLAIFLYYLFQPPVWYARMFLVESNIGPRRRVNPSNHSCWQQWICFSVLSIKVFTDRWTTEVFLYPSNNMTFLTCSKIRITTLYLCSDKLKFSSQWRSRLYCVYFINDGTVVADTLITLVSTVSSFPFCSFTTSG